MSRPETIGSKLLYGEFVYYHVRTVNSRSYYECNRKGECKARAITAAAANREGIVVLKGLVQSSHTHPSTQPGAVQSRGGVAPNKKKS